MLLSLLLFQQLSTSYIANVPSTLYTPNLQQIFLSLLLERAEPLFVVGRQFAGFVFELLQLLQLGRGLEIANLIVQSQEGNGRLDRLAGFRRQTDNLEWGKVDKILSEQT